MSDYMVRVTAEAVRLGLDKRVGMFHVNVIHDDDCPMAGGGQPPCRCYPEIEFLDGDGNPIT